MILNQWYRYHQWYARWYLVVFTAARQCDHERAKQVYLPGRSGSRVGMGAQVSLVGRIGINIQVEAQVYMAAIIGHKGQSTTVSPSLPTWLTWTLELR